MTEPAADPFPFWWCHDAESFDIGEVYDQVPEQEPPEGWSEWRRRATWGDPLLFAVLYLRDHLTDGDGRTTFADPHLDWCRQAWWWVDQPDGIGTERHAQVAPRDTGKSTWWYLLLPMWAAAHGHVKFIAAFAHSATQAQNHLRTFRHELDTNELLRRDYPTLCARSRRQVTDGAGMAVDNESMMVTRSGFAFVARGIDSSNLGMKIGRRRPDLIVCHCAGTQIQDEGRWMAVEDHPSFTGYRECESRIVQVWGLPFDEVVTPEHRYWAKWINGRRAKSRPASWCEAQDLDGYHYLGTPIDTTVQPPQAIPVKRRFVAQRGTDGRVTHGSDWRYVEVIPEYFHDPEFWWFVGLWWGDGHLAGSAYVGVTVANSQPRIRERLLAFVAKMQRRASTVNRVGCQQIVWSWREVNDWLRTWKQGIARKTPPAWVEQLDPCLQEELVEGYADADGYRTDDAVRITSIHLDGLLALRRILARLGRAATIRRGPGPRMELFDNGYVSISQQKYDLRWSLRQERYKANRTHIADGYLWNKVRSVAAGRTDKFAPIRTANHTYITHFGLSHNCDDVEPDEADYSPDLAEKRLRTITDAVLPMNLRARVVLTGTTTMAGSIVHQLVQSVTEPDEEPAKWILDEHWTCHYYPPIVERDDGSERSTWPAKWPYEYLLSIRHTRSYSKNFANQPLNPDSGWWRPEDIQYWDLPVYDRNVLWVDGAVTVKKTSDWTGLAVVGLSERERAFVVREAVQVRLSGEELRDKALELIDLYEVDYVVVEANQGGDLWYLVFRDMPVKVTTVTAKEPKQYRLRRLLAGYQYQGIARCREHKVLKVDCPDCMRRGAVYHERPLTMLERQALAYPLVAHEDAIDAVAGAVEHLLWILLQKLGRAGKQASVQQLRRAG